MEPFPHDFSIQDDLLLQPQCTKCNTSVSTLNSDLYAFSKVIMFAIHRLCKIATETLQDEKLLMDDENAMVNILKNINLVKSTISYLLQEKNIDADTNHFKSDDTPLFEYNDESDEDCGDMFYINACKQKDHDQPVNESSSSVVYMEEDATDKEKLVLRISRGLVGGIAIMSMIAKGASKGKKLSLAEDKKALREMLEIVQMVKFLIT